MAAENVSPEAEVDFSLKWAIYVLVSPTSNFNQGLKFDSNAYDNMNYHFMIPENQESIEIVISDPNGTLKVELK